MIESDVDWRKRLTAALPRMIIGAVLGAAALYLAFRGVSVSELRDAIARTDTRWLLAGLACVAASIGVYTLRWWLLFTPDHRARRYGNLLTAVLIGQSINILVPARLGELARVYVVGVRESISKVRVLATIIVEKIVDFAMFAIAVVLLLIGTSMPAWLSRSGMALVIAAAVVTTAALALAIWGRSFLRIADAIGRRLPGKWGSRIHRLADSALLSLQFIRSWRTLTAVSMLSAVVLVLSVTTNYLLLRACGIRVPYAAALFLMVVLRVGEAPPSLPGKLGVFHYLVVLALSLFGVERSTALGFAFVLYAVAVIPVVIAGMLLLASVRRGPAVQPVETP